MYLIFHFRTKSIEKTFVNRQDDSKVDNLRLTSLKNSVNAILQMTKECLPYPWECKHPH